MFILHECFLCQIRAFPSKEFYEGALEDGDDVERVTSRPWHEHRCFGPYTFFDIDGEESQPPGSGSWVNKDEVEFVLVLYRHLVALYPELKGSPTVAVISPYKLQVKLLRQRFTEVLGKETARLVDINTVDGFQVYYRSLDVAQFLQHNVLWHVLRFIPLVTRITLSFFSFLSLSM